MSSVDRMMQGKPAGKFDEHTVDTIKTILSDHDEPAAAACQTDQAETDLNVPEPALADDLDIGLAPVTDIQPKPKLSAQAILDSQEEALASGTYLHDLPEEPADVAEDADHGLVIEPDEIETDLLAEDQIAVLPDDPDADFLSETPPQGASTDQSPGAPDVMQTAVLPELAPAEPQQPQEVPQPDVTDAAIAQIVKRDKVKSKLRRRRTLKSTFGIIAMPFVALYRTARALVMGTAITATGMANGIGWVRVTLKRIKTWLDPYLTRRRVFLIAYIALFALRPILMTILTVLFFLTIGYAFFRHGPDRVWYGVFRLIAQYSEVNSADAALMRNRFDRFAVRWNSAARFLPESTAQAIAVPDFEALEEQDRAHEAIMAERLQRMHEQV